MPTYQYICRDCSHEFEEFQSMVDDALTICPKCKGKIERVITGGAGFIFKGDGFYITDYRSKQYKKDAAKDSSPTSASSSTSDSTSSSSTTKSDKSKSSDKSTPTPAPAPAKPKSDSK